MANAADEIREFVHEALGAGQSRKAIEDALVAAGWPAAQVERAMASFADSDFPVPVPRPRPTVSAREAFLYLTLFLALAITAVQLSVLMFNLIDTWIADPVDAALRGGRELYRAQTIRWAIASLIVAFPVFALLTRSVNRAIRENPVRRLSPVRHWLTYLTLFAAAATIISDLIWLIYSLLNGDLTLRFGLKLVVVAVIAGAIFAYYLDDMRERE
jgi:hypothetical protein